MALRDHFPFGPRGSTVSGRQAKYRSTVGSFLRLSSSVFSLRPWTRAHSSLLVKPSVGLVMEVWADKLNLLTHNTHAHSAEADVATASRKQAPIMMRSQRLATSFVPAVILLGRHSQQCLSGALDETNSESATAADTQVLFIP